MFKNLLGHGLAQRLQRILVIFTIFVPIFVINMNFIINLVKIRTRNNNMVKVSWKQ